MAERNQIQNATSSNTNKYLSRADYYWQVKHLNDEYKNLGFNYRGKILKTMTSSELWANPMQAPFYARIEALITFLLEQTKSVKKHFSIAHSKNGTNIN